MAGELDREPEGTNSRAATEKLVVGETASDGGVAEAEDEAADEADSAARTAARGTNSLNDGAGFSARLALALPPGTKAGARIEGSAADGGEIVVVAAAGAAATGTAMGAGTRAGGASAAEV